MIKIIFLMVLFWIPQFINAQNTPDSLVQKSYKELIIDYNTTSVFGEREVYGKAYIKKAKKDHNPSKLVTGYYLMAYLYNDSKVLMYCDSIIALTRASSDKFYPATAYSAKGSYYYSKRAYKKALDNFITANSYARKHNNNDIIFKSNYLIGILKNRIGENEEAIQLHRENFIYAKHHRGLVGKIDYLNSIFALAHTFNDLKILDSATFYNSYGIRESLRLKSKQKYNHFVLNSGTINYYKAQYSGALDSIKKALPYFEETGDKPNMAVGYFYLGKLYFEFNKEKEAIFYFKKVDTVFRQNKDLLPKLRENYELLINYYKNKGDLKQRLNYVEQLITLDSILYDNELYLCKNIMKEYDIPRLRAEKENIIHELGRSERKEYQARIIIKILLAAVLLSIAFSYYQYNKRKSYKKQAEGLIHKKHIELNHARKKSLQKKTIGIPKEVENRILSNLEKFENDKNYLDPETNLHDLAKTLQTNDNHLSRVINHHKGLSFPNYLNNLRIKYAIEALKANAIYRKYTNKALANEFGFKRAEPFSRAFLNHAQTRPSDFIRELEYAK